MDSIGYYLVTAIVIGGFIMAYFATKRIMNQPTKGKNFRRADRRRKRS